MIEGFGTIYLFSIPSVILGLIVSFKKSRGKTKLQLIKINFLVGLMIGLLVTGINVNRINFIFYSIIFLQALGVYYVIRVLNRIEMKAYILVIYIIFFLLFTKVYFTTYQTTIQNLFNAGLQESLEYAEEKEFEKYYISSEIAFGGRGNMKSVEIATLFFEKIDIPYYQGKTNVLHGKESLEYSLRYRYIDFEPSQISNETGCVYILPEYYWDYFSEGEYEKVRFLNFFVSYIKNEE